MIPMLRQTHCLALAVILMIPMGSLADEGLEPPEIHPACNQEPEQREIKKERIWNNWPDGSVKYKSVYFTDGTWVEYAFYQSGQLKREAYSGRFPVEGRPKTTINKKHGTEKRWHENGQLSSCAVYEKGKPVGTRMLFAEDGTPMASWTYENGKEIEHLTYSKVFGWQPFNK